MHVLFCSVFGGYPCQKHLQGTFAFRGIPDPPGIWTTGAVAESLAMRLLWVVWLPDSAFLHGSDAPLFHCIWTRGDAWWSLTMESVSMCCSEFLGFCSGSDAWISAYIQLRFACRICCGASAEQSTLPGHILFVDIRTVLRHPQLRENMKWQRFTPNSLYNLKRYNYTIWSTYKIIEIRPTYYIDVRDAWKEVLGRQFSIYFPMSCIGKWV